MCGPGGARDAAQQRGKALNAAAGRAQQGELPLLGGWWVVPVAHLESGARDGVAWAEVAGPGQCLPESDRRVEGGHDPRGRRVAQRRGGDVLKLRGAVA